MASNADILREYGKARLEKKKAMGLMHAEPIYCQMPGCQNTKATNKGKYCVVCKVERRSPITNRIISVTAINHHYGERKTNTI